MRAKTVKQIFKILSLILIGFYFSSCNNSSTGENLMLKAPDEIGDYEITIQDSGGDANLNPSHLSKNLKIIKSANVKYKVKKVKTATKQIKQIAHQYDAYISSLRFENNLYKLENKFTLKVPQEYFNIVMDSIVKTAEFVDYENITTKDVTEEYIDIQARLKTKLEVKERYEIILKKNAKTVKDILDTEEKLQVIQEEIEAAQGKLKYLADKVAYSTIEIELYETVNYKEEPKSYEKSFGSKSKDGIIFGWNIIENIIITVIHIWPILLIGGVIFILLRKKRLKRNK